MGFRKVQKCSKDLRISRLKTYCTFARTFVGLCCSVVFTFVNHSQKLRICQKYYQFQNGTPCRKEVFSPIQYYRHVLDSHYNKLYYSIVPLSPSLEILLRSKKWVPMTVSPTVSLSLNCILIRWHKGGNISVNTSCSFHTGA